MLHLRLGGLGLHRRHNASQIGSLVLVLVRLATLGPNQT
eukprot:COSAG02_NODE_32217_length_520_cov_0.610451_2_plen_38_part_01